MAWPQEARKIQTKVTADELKRMYVEKCNEACRRIHSESVVEACRKFVGITDGKILTSEAVLNAARAQRELWRAKETASRTKLAKMQYDEHNAIERTKKRSL